MSRRRWQQIVLTIPESSQELLVGQLALLPFSGFLQDKHRLTCTLEKRRWNPAFERRLRHVLERFQREFPDTEIGFSVSTIQEQNWNARWEQSAGLVVATDKIVIKPSWKKLRRRDRRKVVLRIDPKMSFGTGHHETTRLCLLLLERYVRKGMKVLDMGTGTGILAIASVKLGVGKAAGIDNDAWAVKNARENVKRNGVGGKVTIRKGGFDSLPKRKFDLILSNIDMKTNVDSLPRYPSVLKPGGILILSGLLASDVQRLLDSLAHRNLIPVEIVIENEWVALALTKVS